MKNYFFHAFLCHVLPPLYIKYRSINRDFVYAGILQYGFNFCNKKFENISKISLIYNNNYQLPITTVYKVQHH